MKLAIKAAVSGAVMLAATAANAANVTPGDVLLFVTNASQTSFYIEDLGVTMGSVLSQATLTAGAGVATIKNPGSFTIGSNIATGTPQPNLASFISANPGSSWTLLAQETPGAGNGPAQKTFFVTVGAGNGQAALDDPNQQAGFSSSSIGTIAGSAALGAFENDINLLTYTNNVNTTEGWGGGAGAGPGAAITYGFNVPNGILVGQSQNLYAFSTNTSKPMEFKSSNLLTLNADGTLTLAGGGSTVPLPAAVWLFTSGLLGLAGIGRRRQAAAA